jgi:hypothetical protein
MGPIGCPETSVTTNLRCVVSQKSENRKYKESKEIILTIWNIKIIYMMFKNVHRCTASPLQSYVGKLILGK